MGHSAGLTKAGMIVFGGFSYQQTPLNLVFTYAPKTKKWTAGKPGGLLPPPRAFHTAVVSTDDIMYVFGGVAENGEALSDLWSYEKAKWTDMSAKATGFGPSPRFLHSATILENYLFIGYGASLAIKTPKEVDDTKAKGKSKNKKGKSKKSGKALLEITKKQSKSKSKKSKKGKEDDSPWEFAPEEKTFSENILSAPLPLDDLFVYNLDTDTWEEEIFMGSFPFARMGTTLVSIPNRNPPKTKGKSKSKGKKRTK